MQKAVWNGEKKSKELSRTSGLVYTAFETFVLGRLG